MSASCEIALRWMPENTFDDKSTLVQVMAWCHQATSHYWANVVPELCRHRASRGHKELTALLLRYFSRSCQDLYWNLMLWMHAKYLASRGQPIMSIVSILEKTVKVSGGTAHYNSPVTQHFATFTLFLLSHGCYFSKHLESPLLSEINWC